MQQGVEFHGRLSRSDRRPASPGSYDLLFQIHPHPSGDRALWTETHRSVDVRPGGFFDVVLGLESPIDPKLFSRSPRWLGVRVLREDQPGEECAPRVPLLGGSLLIQADLDDLSQRVLHVEDALIGGGDDESGRAGRLRALPFRLQKLFSDLQLLQERVDNLEEGEAFVELVREVGRLHQRLEELVGDGGRLDKIEDELEDLVGPDGDVVDLTERMDAIEGRAPELLQRLRSPDYRSIPEHLEDLQAAIARVERRQERVEQGLRRVQGHEDHGPDASNVLTTTFTARGDLSPGTVVVLQDGELAACHTPGDPKVVGVVLAAEPAGKKGVAAVTVAVAGVVSCRVLGPVVAGDLLVTGNVVGHARTASKAPTGTVLGKALTDHGEGRGVIRVRLF